MPKDLGEYDLIVLLSANSQFDYQKITDQAKVIFDTRNAFADIKNRENIHLL